VAVLAIATAALADGDAPTDIYIIGVDSLTTFTSGTYAGLPNPNYGRLTLLYAHYTPGTEHFPQHWRVELQWQPRQPRCTEHKQQQPHP
jgi:hypothetical protein